MFSQSSRPKKVFLLFFLTVIFSLFFVRPAYAQLEPVPIPIVSPWDKLDKAIGGAVAQSLLSGLRYFLNKMAYDTATWLAAGGKGQSPMWWEKPGEYFTKAGEEAAGEAIFVLGDNIAFLKKYHINLCVPPEPKFQLWLKLAVTEAQTGPPTPRCNFKQIQQAWSRIGEDPNYWRQVGLGFQPGQNDLSLLLGASEAVKEVSLVTQKEVDRDMSLKGQAKTSENKVTSAANTPVVIVKQAAAGIAPTEKKKETEQQAYTSISALSMGNISSVFIGAGKMFYSTLTQKLMKRLMDKGFISLTDLMKGGGALTSPEGQVVGGRQAAEAAFAEFLKPTLAEVEQYAYLADLNNECGASNPTPFCGALDSHLFDALSQSEPLTVKEAMDKGFLDSTGKLWPPGACGDKKIYCYENLVKLRQLRILPVGWELAAKKSPSEKPYTLQDAIDQFYTVGADLYHLINPNWLLKAPVAKCGAMAYGADFMIPPSDLAPGQRAQYCADVQNCVEESANNSCSNDAWGYCLKEKNIWQLGGDSCDEQFNTCTTYTDNQNKSVSYLANTLDKGICAEDNTGCRAYATSSAWVAASQSWVWNANDSKIYLNGKVEQCDIISEGCTKFIRTGAGLVGGAEVANDELPLKKAPAYYNCYGESLIPSGVPTVNTLSSSTLKWAVNKADLSKIFASWSNSKKEQCNRFAGVCSYEEVGCELYAPSPPAGGGASIPGILTSNDQCPSECVGYESFKQQDTVFETAPTDFAFFIPTTATACQSSEEGCDEFIDLEKQSAGGESKEYYSQLRTCSQNEAEGATYYTWEGSDTAGYQLKSFNLKYESVNGPPYSTVAVDANICGEAKYKEHKADTDCREFYDKNGVKSYRIYTKTVTVSATECKKLRKSVSDLTSCGDTGGTWDVSQKICVYLAIPAEGQSCSAKASGCRAYKGNAGHNFKIVDYLGQNFESGTAGSLAKNSTGWDGTFSAESTVVGGKSLKVNNQTFTTTTLPLGKTYIFSFWAKGSAPGLKVEFYPSNDLGELQGSAEAIASSTVSLSAEWRNYTAGPFTVAWNATTTIKFSSVPSGLFFLDNISAKQMVDNIFRIKDSWDVPPLCDNVLYDDYGGSQGGSEGNPYRLLPQAMLGCQRYTNRQNQAVDVKSFTSMCREEAVGCEEFTDTHNTAASASSTVNAKCALFPAGANNTQQAKDCQNEKGEPLCSILPGLGSCRFTYQGSQPSHGTGFVISSDNETISIPADFKVYLVNDSKNYCGAENVGCQALGPISYVGANNHSPVYLKNQPDNYSTILCESAAEGCDTFKTTAGGSAYFKDPEVSGKLCEYKKDAIGSNLPRWVRKGGICSDDTSKICQSNSDCDGATATCDLIDSLPCGYGLGFGFSLPKNGSSNYFGAVGLCPAPQNTCSEFIDPAITTPTNPLGTPYYVLNNDKIDRRSCLGQASLQEGCILFNETSQGSRLWNAQATYNESESKNYVKVNPVVATPNDSNVILKVQRDRVCGQWLTCKSSMTVRDPSVSGGWKEVCTELAPCEKAGANTSLTGRCEQWVDGDSQLTLDNYKNRSIQWGAMDYSGYSLPEAYQIATLSVENAYMRSLQGPNGENVFDNKGAITESCRGYSSEEADLSSVDFCSLTKVDYQATGRETITKSFLYNELLGGEGVCDGGYGENERGVVTIKKGLACSSSADCADERTQPAGQSYISKEDGVCLLDKKVTRSPGWPGYCLDPAFGGVNPSASGRGCALWYPLSTPSGSVSLDNLNRDAGYIPPEGSGQYFCVQAKGNANRDDAGKGESYLFTSYQNTPQFFPPTNDGYNENYAGWQTPGGADVKLTTAYPDIKMTEDEIINPYTGSPIYFFEIVSVGLKPTYLYDDDWPNQELFIFRDQRLGGIFNIRASNRDGRYWSGPLKRKGDNWVMDMVWIESTTQATERSYEKITKKYCDVFRSSEKQDLFAFRLTFDQTGKLKDIRSKICDSGSNKSGMMMDLNFYLTEACVDIRQVVETNEAEPMGFSAKARTDRVWNLSGYSVGGDLKTPIPPAVSLNLPYDQLFTPFGSFSQSAQPVITSLSTYLTDLKLKGDFEQIQAVKKAGYWPIWMAPGGATPLNCKGDNDDDGIQDADCGNIGLCPSGSSNEGLPCDLKKNKDNDNPACHSTEEDKCMAGNLVGYSDPEPKRCQANSSKTCSLDSDCPSIEKKYLCKDKNQIRGLCVGGLNHGLACGSAKDCPSKKHTDSSEETVEQGVCVGSALDSGTSIPSTPAGVAYVDAKYQRLAELFVQGFGTWVWGTNGHYDEAPPGVMNYDDSQSVDFHSTNSQANVVPHPPQIYSLTPSATAPSGFTWGTPNSFSIMNNNQPTTGNIPASGSFTAVLRFFALADNDQMPIVRMAIDWGDGTAAAPNVYTVKGWFKNRKPYCDTGDYKVCGDGKFYNTPCSNNSPDCVSIGGQCQPAKDDPNTSITEHTGLYFGNSSSACDTGYYEFKHVYTCSGSTDPHWNGTACSFTPKVQVLDNWGWCNGTCQSISGTTGCWDDSTLLKTDPPHPENQACSIDNPVTANQHWTNFGGTINVTP